MKRHARLARHYIRAADLRAVYIAASGYQVRIGIARDPAQMLMRRQRAGAKVYAVYWVGSAAAADKLIDAAYAALPGLGWAADPAAIAATVAALPDIARAAGVALTDDATVQRRALDVVADVERRISAMHSSGHLRSINAEYRAARTAAAKRNEPFMSYGDYIERYKIKLLYELAAAAKAR